VVATVIPVLFIAATFQLRYWERREERILEPSTSWWVPLLTLLAVVEIVLGEVAALVALYQGREQPVTLIATLSSLVLLGFVVVLEPLAPWRLAFRERASTAVRVGILAAVVLVAALLLFRGFRVF
jgi:hypothetical protein